MFMASAEHRLRGTGSSSGRYQFKYWVRNEEGARIAVPPWKAPNKQAIPDLINTAYRNPDGTRVVYGIVFDLDAHRAHDRWKDVEGKLDWGRIKKELTKKCPEVLSYITHVVRSTGGKGLALIVGINPLPLMPSTFKNQEIAQRLQSRLIVLFNELGLGADPSARGLERDFPNFQDSRKCIFEASSTVRKIEADRTAVVSQLHTSLNKLDAERRANKRLFPDARVEAGIAKLVGWLLGTLDPGRGHRVPRYLTGDEIWVTTQELSIITGLGEKFLRKFLANPPEWLLSRYEGRLGWRLCIPLSLHVFTLLEGSETILQNTSAKYRKQSFQATELKHPMDVVDGERNHWLTLMALTYKWGGYSKDTAMQKIELRMTAIPGFEYSRNCKQLKAIVRSIYTGKPETFAMFGYKDLPEWITDDTYFCSFIGRSSTRRGKTPCAFSSGGPQENFKEEIVLSPAELRFRNTEVTVNDGTLKKDFTKHIMNAELDLCSKVSASSDDHEQKISERKIVRFAAIRRKQRVGIFHEDRLVLCLTRKHYRASAILQYLSGLPDFRESDLKIFSPHKGRQQKYYGSIDGAQTVIPADAYCGRRETREERLAEWFVEKEQGQDWTSKTDQYL